MYSSREVLRQVLNAHKPEPLQLDDVRDAAVLIPIVDGSAPSLILTVRTETLPSHKGQISFPGGSIDRNDKSPIDAALREAHEELGIEPSAVEILGKLDTVPTFVSGYVIHPVVGWVRSRPTLMPNPAEVARVLEIPIDDLVEDIRAAPGFSYGGRTFPTEAWIWHDNIIWGATARVLRLLLTRLAEAGLAELPGDAPEWAFPPIARAGP